MLILALQILSTYAKSQPHESLVPVFMPAKGWLWAPKGPWVAKEAENIVSHYIGHINVVSHYFRETTKRGDSNGKT